jgi:hypothetical protein
MTKILHRLLILTVLFSASRSLGQDYEWVWTQSGGGAASGPGQQSVFEEGLDETIIDIVVDSDNNYYTLSGVTAGTRNYAGTTLGNYGLLDIIDIAIIAHDCEGNLLWSHIVGGSGEDQAYKLGLDSTNGLYVAVNVNNRAYVTNTGEENFFPPVHFSADDVMPPRPVDGNIAHVGNKRGFLLKFDKNSGDLLWRKDIQGPVTYYTRHMTVGRIFIDQNDVIHQIVGLLEGEHLDGTATVAGNQMQFFMVKYDTEGNLMGVPQPLPMTSGTGTGFGPHNTIFVYDHALNRYYISGQSAFFQTQTFGGVALQSTGTYIIAFDATSFEEVWRKELETPYNMTYEQISQLAIDDNSDIFISGKYSVGPDGYASFGGYELPEYVGLSQYGNPNYGHVPYTMKISPDGAVQWLRTPDGYVHSSPDATGSYFNRGLVINGDELAVLVASGSHIWGDYSVGRPPGHHPDPVILRLDKHTGAVNGLHDIVAGAGVTNEFRAIAVDSDGNYIAGGHFFGILENPAGDNTYYSMGKTDLLLAKLAASQCGSGGLAVSDQTHHNTLVSLYPNPTNGGLNIQTTLDINRVEIYNSLGQRITSRRFSQTIDLAAIPSGVYVVRLTDSNGKAYTQKVVKQ